MQQSHLHIEHHTTKPTYNLTNHLQPEPEMTRKRNMQTSTGEHTSSRRSVFETCEHSRHHYSHPRNVKLIPTVRPSDNSFTRPRPLIPRNEQMQFSRMCMLVHMCASASRVVAGLLCAPLIFENVPRSNLRSRHCVLFNYEVGPVVCKQPVGRCRLVANLNFAFAAETGRCDMGVCAEVNSIRLQIYFC